MKRSKAVVAVLGSALTLIACGSVGQRDLKVTGKDSGASDTGGTGGSAGSSGSTAGGAGGAAAAGGSGGAVAGGGSGAANTGGVSGNGGGRGTGGSPASGGAAGNGGAQGTGGSVGGTGGSNGDAGTITVNISSPSQTVNTNGTISVQVVVSGGSADSVELYLDGSPYTTLLSPYQYSWNTSGTAEGTHTLTAHATAGGVVIASGARTVIVDRTPPKLVSTVPAAGATNVFIDNPISATFSEPLLPSSVVIGSVTMTTSSGAISVTPSLSADGRTITLAPQGAVPVPTTLTTTLTVALKDLAGNALAAPATWNWPLPQWVVLGGPINPVPGQSVGATYAEIDGASGAPLASFIESDGTHTNGYVEEWTGSQWTVLGGAINVNPGQDVTGIRLVPGVVGGPVAMIAESDSTHVNVYSLRWSGTKWTQFGAAINPLPAMSVSANLATPASTASGTIAMSINESDGTHVNAYVEEWTGSSWQQLGGAINAVPGQDLGTRASLAWNSAGGPFIAYEESNGVAGEVHVHQLSGSAWPAVGAAINPVAGQSVGTTAPLAITTTGKPAVAVNESDGTHANVYVEQWSGTAWLPVGGALNPVSGQDAAVGNKGLVLDSSNQPIVVIRELASTGGRINIYVNKWTISSWASVGGALNPVPGQDVATGFATVDAKGRPIVAINESDGTFTNLYVERSNN